MSINIAVTHIMSTRNGSINVMSTHMNGVNRVIIAYTIILNIMHVHNIFSLHDTEVVICIMLVIHFNCFA